MYGRGVIRRRIEGVEQQRRTLQDVYNRLAVGRSRKDAQITLRKLAARGDALAEIRQFVARWQKARNQQIRDLLIAEASLIDSPVHQIRNVIATDKQPSFIRDNRTVS